MKIVFEDGDKVFYEDHICTLNGDTHILNGVEGIHVVKPGGDISLVPLTSLKTYRDWVLDRCVEYLKAQEQWEADLLTSDDDGLLESLSVENYDMMLRLQSLRTRLVTAIDELNGLDSTEKARRK